MKYNKKLNKKAKNLITRLSLLNQENNIHSLKNELTQFFSEKENCEEEKAGEALGDAKTAVTGFASGVGKSIGGFFGGFGKKK